MMSRRLASCGRKPFIITPDNTAVAGRNFFGLSCQDMKAIPLYGHLFFLFLSGTKRSLPASAVELHIGFIQDAEHATAAAES